MAAPQADDRRARLTRLAERLAGAREQEAGEDRRPFVVVRLGERDFLLDAADVAETVRPAPLSPAFAAPEHILGIAAVHGRPWTILELGLLLPLPRTHPEDTRHTRWVLLRHPHMHVGFRADAVLGMRFAREEELEPADDPSLWRGVLAQGDARLPVLNPGAVLG